MIVAIFTVKKEDSSQLLSPKVRKSSNVCMQERVRYELELPESKSYSYKIQMGFMPAIVQ